MKKQQVEMSMKKKTKISFCFSKSGGGKEK